MTYDLSLNLEIRSLVHINILDMSLSHIHNGTNHHKIDFTNRTYCEIYSNIDKDDQSTTLSILVKDRSLNNPY